MSSFEEIKKKMVEENEERYGNEIREKYGEEVYETSANIINGLTEEKWIRSETLRQKTEAMLKELAPRGDHKCAEAMEMARLHGEWANCFWADGAYSPKAHTALAKMYVEDERFTAYYEAVVKGGAEFLYKAVEYYCSQK